MKNEQIDYCNNLVKLIKKETGEEKKAKIRNKLYLEIEENMKRWIKAILAPKKVFLQKDEILSISWDCFLFCLNEYEIDGKIPFPGHFYKYTQYYLITHHAERIHLPPVSKIMLTKMIDREPDYEKEEGALMDCDSEAAINLAEIKALCDFLPEEYKSVFEDAFMSMSKNFKDHQRRLNESKIHYTRYCEAKKCFKLMIEFLLLK